MKHAVLLYSFLVVVAGLLATQPAQAQAPAWQSAQSLVAAGSAGGASVVSTATDAAGKVYLVGTFEGTITVGTTGLTSAGMDDAFIAKWDPATRTYEWAQRLGGTGYDGAQAVVATPAGVYVAGYFGSGVADAGPFVLTNTAGLGIDSFVAKLTETATGPIFNWVQTVGNTSSDYANALAVNGANIYVAGNFMSPTLAFGATTLLNAGTYSSTSANSYDIFVAKLVDTGTSASFGWALRLGDQTNDNVSSLVWSNNSLYLGGTFGGPTLALGSSTLTNAGLNDAYVAKLADAGATASFVWGRQLGGTKSESLYSLAVKDNAIYAAGSFYSPTLTVGSIGLSNTAPASTTSDMYVAKLLDAGSTSSVAWAQKAGGYNDDAAFQVVVSGTSVLLTGTFGLQLVANTSLQSALFGSTLLYGVLGDVFVTKLTDTGSFVWAQQAGGPDDELGRSLVVTGPNVDVFSDFRGASITFGTSTVQRNGPGCIARLTDVTLPTRASAALAAVGLSPNPAAGSATVHVPASVGQVTLTLHDALGRVVRTQQPAPSPDYPLDLVGLAPGVYALRVQAGAAVATQQLVVQ